MEQPVHFIYIDKSGKFEVDAATARHLSCMEGPSTVIAIIGSARTGKSYLLSRFFGWERAGFETGASTKPVTRGVWLWARPHPFKPNTQLILLDTEGLDEPGTLEGNDYDYKLFSLTILLASCVLYNTVGKIQRSDIEALRIVLKLSDYIRVKPVKEGPKDHTLSDQLAGALCWVIRDFHLTLDDTPDEYMEDAFRRFEISADGRELVSTLRKYFPKRRCFPLNTPVPDAINLGNLQDLAPNDLSEAFRCQTEDMIHTILNSIASVKKIIGEEATVRTINPIQFLTLANHYVAALNSGQQPCIQDAYQHLLQSDAHRARNHSIKAYRDALTAALEAFSQPRSADDMVLLCATLHDTAMTDFIAQLDKLNLQMQTSNFLSAMLDLLKEEQNKAWNQNNEVSLESSNAVLSDLVAGCAMDEAKYLMVGGHHNFLKEAFRLIMTFLNHEEMGPCCQLALRDFVSGRLVQLGSTVEQTEAELARREQVAAEKKRAEEIEEARAQGRRESKNKYKEQIQEMQEKHQEVCAQHKLEIQLLEKRLKETTEQLEEDLAGAKASWREERMKLQCDLEVERQHSHDLQTRSPISSPGQWSRRSLQRNIQRLSCLGLSKSE